MTRATLAQAGSELAGTILVDGRAPEWPIELALEPEMPPVPAGDRTPRLPALEVVLTPLSVLDLRLVGSLGVQASKVRISSEREAFAWDASGWDEHAELQVELGSIKPNVRRWPEAGAGRFEYEFQRQHDGRYRLVGLVPDVPIAVEVLDAQARPAGPFGARGARPRSASDLE
jgi:hypothetical protein